MSARNDTRNEEIVRMRNAGMSFAAIALELEMRAGRVQQIYANETGGPQGAVIAKPPLLALVEGKWTCTGQGSTTTGQTKESAFNRWKAARRQSEDAAKRRAQHEAEQQAKAAERAAEAAEAQRRMASTRAPRPHVPLVIPVFIQRQHARAAAVQPRLMSMSTTPSRESAD